MSLRMPVFSTNFSADPSPAFSPLLSLVYISASSHLLSNAELEEILTKSRRNNPPLGVTGMLLSYEGVLIQALEGPEEAVGALYERIAKDPRHHRITVLLEEYIPERNFPDWSMGFHHLSRDEAKHLEGFPSFEDANQFLAYFQERPQWTLVLLQSFRTTRR